MKVGDLVRVSTSTHWLHGKHGVVTIIEDNLYIIARFDFDVGGEVEDGYGWMFLPNELTVIDCTYFIPSIDTLRQTAYPTAMGRYGKVISKISALIEVEARDGSNKLCMEHISFHHFDNEEIPLFIKSVFSKMGYRWGSENRNNKYYDVLYWDW